MSFVELLKDYHVPFQVEGHKHSRPGWVNIPCPFCTGNPGWHLGWNLKYGYFNCWRCGGKKTVSTLSTILGIPTDQVKELIRQYKLKSRISTNDEIIVSKKPFMFPSGTTELQWFHERYLNKRGFKNNGKLLGTGPIAHLDNINFKMRIIFPIYWGGRIVSFQGRDITGKSKLKYITCPKNREILFHKDILYTINGFDYKKPLIVVEGVTDVLRIPYQSGATFGIEYTERQVQWIANNFKEVIVLFDDEVQAVKQSKKLSSELRFRGVYAKSEFIKGDPGSLTDKQARDLVRSFGLEPEGEE